LERRVAFPYDEFGNRVETCAIYVFPSNKQQKRIAQRVIRKYRKLAEAGDAIAMFRH